MASEFVKAHIFVHNVAHTVTTLIRTYKSRWKIANGKFKNMLCVLCSITDIGDIGESSSTHTTSFRVFPKAAKR